MIAGNQYIFEHSEIKTFGMHLNTLLCYYNIRTTTGLEGRSNKIYNNIIYIKLDTRRT